MRMHAKVQIIRCTRCKSRCSCPSTAASPAWPPPMRGRCPRRLRRGGLLCKLVADVHLRGLLFAPGAGECPLPHLPSLLNVVDRSWHCLPGCLLHRLCRGTQALAEALPPGVNALCHGLRSFLASLHRPRHPALNHVVGLVDAGLPHPVCALGRLLHRREHPVHPHGKPAVRGGRSVGRDRTLGVGPPQHRPALHGCIILDWLARHVGLVHALSRLRGSRAPAHGRQEIVDDRAACLDAGLPQTVGALGHLLHWNEHPVHPRGEPAVGGCRSIGCDRAFRV
mmetsp:Transcript_92291/g.287300  ORF Transcript_92291/g.287300 Transcript_92291/m.287300 type:complete len:281 (-) Transcript_92291:480-1322(-)